MSPSGELSSAGMPGGVSVASDSPPSFPARLLAMDLVALELFYVGLLGLASLAIVFVSAVVLKNLYRGQR